MTTPWLLRCIPGLSSILVVLLVLVAFTDVHQACPSWACNKTGERGGRHHKRPSYINPSPTASGRASLPALTLSQKIFMVYICIVHLDTFLFAIRLCISTLTVQGRIKAVLQRRVARPLLRSSSSSHVQSRDDQSSSELDLRPNSRPDPRQFKHDDDDDQHLPIDEVVHAVIIPNFKEDIENLRTTLLVLASHPRARTQYEVYLAMEQTEAGCGEKAAILVSAFEESFLAIRSTIHPSDLPGEIRGKSSNVSFAARKIFDIHRWNKNRGDVIITVIDSDTHLLQDYFTEIRRNHYDSRDSWRSLYVCPIVFDRNAHETNVFVRTADILWGGAGLAGYLPWVPVHIPTSVYSLPLPLAEDVGGWDAGPGAIGEDMHMLLKCYFSSRDGLVTVPIFSPASQCNISAGPTNNAVSQVYASLHARYKQALRHMWGSLDFGYSVHRALQNRRPRLTYIPLFHLLWEAHILPTHFVILLFGSAFYTLTHSAADIHPLIIHALHLCTLLRNSSFFIMQVAFTIYHYYHSLCVNARARDMHAAGIPETFAYRQQWRWKYILERASFPVIAVLFSAIPTIQAQVGHFWTDRLVYHVSLKPVAASGSMV